MGYRNRGRTSEILRDYKTAKRYLELEKSLRPLAVSTIGPPPNPRDYGIQDGWEDKMQEERRRDENNATGTSIVAHLIFFAGVGAAILGWLAYEALPRNLNSSLTPILLLGAVLLVVLSAIVNTRAISQREAIKGRYSEYSKFLAARSAYEEKYAAFREEHTAKLTAFWKALNGIEFEIELGKVFSLAGYHVATTPTTGDQGVDLILRKDNKTTLVQCKALKGHVGVAAARELYGTFMDHKADSAILASVNGFTSGVYDFVRGKPIRLMALDDIISEYSTALAAKHRRGP